GGLESTVLDMTTQPRLLRPGLVTPAQLEAIVGPLKRPMVQAQETVASLPSPGMLARHYAPRAQMHCVADDGKRLVERLCAEGHQVGWLPLTAQTALPEGVSLVRMPHEPAAYAARLYAALHSLDALGVEHIVVQLPADTDD